MRSASNRRTRIGLERLFIASHRSSSSPLLRSTFSSTCLQEYGNHLQIAITSRRSLSFQIINCPEAECSSSRRRQFSPLKNLRFGRFFHEFFSQIGDFLNCPYLLVLTRPHHSVAISTRWACPAQNVIEAASHALRNSDRSCRDPLANLEELRGHHGRESLHSKLR